ncbi:MAG TPA: hypothetical protein VK338_04845, partial [Candidatus Nitrosocosmicus sp.]|nr:hypothetical protein [Candidatus Nitrosocosmicus sp.]
MKKQKLKVADLEDPTKRLKPEEIEEIVEMNDLEDPKIPSYYYDIQNAQEHFFNKGTLSLISGFLFISLTLILLIARDSDIYFWSLLCSFLGFGFSFNRPKSPFPSYILQSGQIVEMPQKGTLESKKLFEAMKKRRNALVLFFFNLPFFAILTYYGSFNPVKSIQTFNWQDVGTLILTFISSVVWTYGIQYIHFWKTLKNEKKEKLITKHSILGFDSFKTNWWHNLLIIMAAISGILFYVFGIISFKPYLGILLSQKITNGTI